MITITQNDNLATLIKLFDCEPQHQRHLIDSWVRTTEEQLDSLPGIISARPHRSKNGTRVVNYAQWKGSGNWERFFRIGTKSWFREMRKYAKPDAHLYEVGYLLDKTVRGQGDL
jgi:hypothetical protein